MAEYSARDEHLVRLNDLESKSLLGCVNDVRADVEGLFDIARSIKLDFSNNERPWNAKMVQDLCAIIFVIMWNSKFFIDDENKVNEISSLRKILNKIKGLLLTAEIYTQYNDSFDQEVALLRTISKRRSCFNSYSVIEKAFTFVTGNWDMLYMLLQVGIIENYDTYLSLRDTKCEKCLMETVAEFFKDDDDLNDS